MAEVLSRRYGVAFTRSARNLYRDGADSVAWHGDRVARELPEAVVAVGVARGGPAVPAAVDGRRPAGRGSCPCPVTYW